MAFNWQTFKTRALTAIVFVVVMLVGLIWNHWSFFILFSIIHFGCWIEYQKLVALIDPGYKEITPYHKYGIMIAGWCVMLWFTGDAYRLFGMQLHELGWWIGLVFVFVLPLTELLLASHIRLKNIAHSFFGLLYISLSFGLLMDLESFVISRDNSHGLTFVGVTAVGIIPPIIIFSIWINDTMAYIVGSLIGKHSLSPVSPKKTWEGTIGGIILAVVVMGLLNLYIFDLRHIEPVYHWFLIPAFAAIAGTFGDLLESKLKRLAGVKDSGSIMPGHGGFLDRFDSLLLATPLVWLYIKLFLP